MMANIENRKPALLALYAITGLITAITLVRQIIAANWHNVLIASAAMALYSVPVLLERVLQMRLPVTCECIVVCFAFCAQVLGEINAYYVYIPLWDSMLHYVIGFLVASAALALTDRQQHRRGWHLTASPWLIIFFAFSLAAAVGVLWEFFEFSCDLLTDSDMQKDFILHSISSVTLNPNVPNTPLTVEVESLVVNGEDWGLGGYLDIGLYDTVKDMFVNCLGAASFCCLFRTYHRRGGKQRIVEHIAPVYIGRASDKGL